MSHESNTDRKTMVECLGGVLSVDEVPDSFSTTGDGWELRDNINKTELSIHPDDVPEVVAMLKAFHKRMDERDDVDLDTSHEETFEQPLVSD